MTYPEFLRLKPDKPNNISRIMQNYYLVLPFFQFYRIGKIDHSKNLILE